MKKLKLIFLILALCWQPAQPVLAESRVLLININGDINPITAQYIISNVEHAEKNDFECLIIEMDTPGGLLAATQDIVKKVLSADVPVVMYVSPSGAGAVSAGVFITMACHLAIMAEGTNIGAAHPVGIGGQQDTSKVMSEKITNYAASYMRGIAEKRKRNADWAENAVRQSVSINENEALKLNVIDYICPTLTNLLETIDGKAVEVLSGADTLATKDATIVRRNMSWHQNILYKISNPTIAYILLILGIYGLFFELSNPGAILPGVVGGIFIILAFFALQTLPIRAAGLALILFALILFLLEIKVTSFGILTIGGVIAMFLGSLMLFEDTGMPNIGVDWRVALAAAITTGLFFFFAMGMALKARLTRPSTGAEGLIDEIGIAISDISPEGDVKVHGEFWKATSEQKIKKGEKIQVIQVEGMTLRVKSAG